MGRSRIFNFLKGEDIDPLGSGLRMGSPAPTRVIQGLLFLGADGGFLWWLCRLRASCREPGYYPNLYGIDLHALPR